MPARLPSKLSFCPGVIFTDIDDTLTLHGRLPVDTYYSLKLLQERGVKVIPVTGACSGWCDCIVRTWPIDTIIGENGALVLTNDKRYNKEFIVDPEIQRGYKRRLLSIAEEVCSHVPEAKLTNDTNFRETDIAFDVAQDCILPGNKVIEVVDICKSHGANVRVSSIHINVWFGQLTKASTSSLLLERLNISKSEALFVGDSPNDEDMFKLLDTTVGVANIKPFLPELMYQPTYITNMKGGYGFKEVAEAVLA